MSNYSKSSGRRSGRGPRRHRDRESESRRPATPVTPPKLGLWQKIVAIFTGSKPASKNGNGKTYAPYTPRAASTASPTRDRNSAQPSSPTSAREPREPRESRESRPVRKPEAVEVTSAKLYVGNLSFDASESDLSELFNGVGAVKSAEIVSHKNTEKSKGFGFVTMSSLDEAKRAVEVLHDKEFMGRKLVVSGAKTPVERS